MPSLSPRCPRWLSVAVLLLASAAHAQPPADQAANLLLNGARRAYNEKNYPFAAARFREFLAKFPGHKEIASARYGLALCLIEGPERNLTEAAGQLQQAAAVKDSPDFPHVVYYLGFAQRGLGVADLASAASQPAQAGPARDRARARFDEAAKSFETAVKAFTDRAPKTPDGKDLPLDLEWAARARCDQAEMLLRNLKAKEAQAIAAPFVDDANLAKSRYRRLGLYHHGFASFLLKDHLTAGKSLNQLTPFADSVFGTHARYLLARVHHADGERAEAAAHYQGVLTQHAQQVKEAKEALKNPQALANDPDEKARVTALANGPTPDHVARATLLLGVMQYEDGKFAEALARFDEFRKQFASSPLASEVELRVGLCQVQLKQYDAAIKTLQPVADKTPALADQALLWIGRAQAGAADPANVEAFVKAQKTALDTLRRAAEKAQGQGPDVKARRALILFETIEVQQAAKMHREAAATCAQLMSEKLAPERDQEAMQKQAAALHLAGDFAESDKVCVKFRDQFPKSPLLPAVAFRHAENAAFAALAAEKNSSLPDRASTLGKLNDEAIKRYGELIEKYPEFAHVNLARYGLALAHSRKGDVEKCREILEKVPSADWTGELAVVPYVLADCLIRTAPADADDALAAGKLNEQLTKAAELLGAFASAQQKAPQTPDALLKLGFCHQRLADLQAQPPEKVKALTAARTAYEQLMQQFPQHALLPQAVFERARCLAGMGDVGGATNELRRFTADPLRKAPVAPMAQLRLATLMRAQNQAAQAAALLATARQTYEPELAKDAARASWVPLLQYHHGLALRESGKLSEARAAFAVVVDKSPDRPEAIEAALRFGQCLKEEGQQKAVAARQVLAQQGKKPEELSQARAALADGLKMLGEAVKYLEGRAEQLKAKKPDAPTRARMLYDAAWAARALADEEVETAREKLRQEQWQKLKDAVAKKTPPGQQPPLVAASEVPLSAVPVQEGEKKVRAVYQALIADFPDVAENADARFELAELLAGRGEHDAAVKLLQDAIDKEPPPELTEKVRLRLAVCYAAKGDTKSALQQLQPVLRNDKSPLQAQATYRAGEVLLQMKDAAEAVKMLARFRDHGPFQNLPGQTDRALLRLGHALGQLKQWDASRQAHEQVVGRFPQSPWAAEARYGIGWAHQNKGEHDQAVGAYQQVAATVVTELGARAQLNIGQCRLAQKRYGDAATAFLVVPFTYDYPELNAVALLEAARALAEDKQRERAVKLLERLLRDHPDGEHAEAARKRLDELKKG